MKCPKNTCTLYGRCSYPTACVGIKIPEKPWTGPRPHEIDAVGRLLVEVPPDRWPHGPPDHHEVSCTLHDPGGVGAYCDCAASAADDSGFGVAS